MEEKEKSLPKSVTLQLRVNGKTRKQIEDWGETRHVPNTQVAGRLLDWFGDQSIEVQRAIIEGGNASELIFLEQLRALRALAENDAEAKIRWSDAMKIAMQIYEGAGRLINPQEARTKRFSEKKDLGKQQRGEI